MTSAKKAKIPTPTTAIPRTLQYCSAIIDIRSPAPLSPTNDVSEISSSASKINQYTHTIAFIFTKVHNIYAPHKCSKTDRKRRYSSIIRRYLSLILRKVSVVPGKQASGKWCDS